MKKTIFIALILLLAILALNAESKLETKQGAILHCWCWSFKTIEANMEKIASAGFTAVQTSPANECLVGDDGGLELMSSHGGKWYYHYQPTDWKIGNYQLGTRDDFKKMCDTAKKFGIAVIVDVVPNHTTPDVYEISDEFVEAVGGWDKLYHEHSDHDIRSYANRSEVTSARSGGLPDVNTENPLFQAYFMKYMNDLIDCGADGFRFDTAKHIALPDDPVDPAATENDFWPIFTGKKAINGEKLKNSGDLFIYGEVLQDQGSREDAYGKLFPVTASNYGKVLRTSIKSGKLKANGISNFQNKVAPEVVTWVESHDNYANEGESAGLTNFQIRAGWALIAARRDGTPLFFNRPKGKEATQFPGESKIGDAGNDEWFHPEVAEVNKFRKTMLGETEEFVNGPNTGVLIIKRGDKGCVIINLNDKDETIQLNIALPKGNYIDKANKTKFVCKNSVLQGKIKAHKICVIY